MNSGNFFVFETIKTAWSLTKGSKKTFWAILFFLFLTQIGIALVHKCSFIFMAQPVLLGLVVIRTIFVALQQILLWGLIYLGVQRSANQTIYYGMVAKLFNARLILKMIGVYLLQIIIILPAIILFVIAMLLKTKDPNLQHTYNLIDVALVIISVALLIYLLLRMYIAQAIVLAENAGPWAAIKKSFRATKSRVWKLIGLTIINSWIVFLGALLLFIGLIWAIPYAYINYGVVYRRLIADQQESPTTR